MSLLYITADKIGMQSGGGRVTFEESEALKSLGPCEVYDRDRLEGPGRDPWKWDIASYQNLILTGHSEFPRLAHFYAGTFPTTIPELKRRGTTISYTAAAHDIELSRREHERLGIPYHYSHLTDPELRKRYLGGYLAADVLVCPSQHSSGVMRGFGYQGRIEVIPHGCDLPERTVEPPARFTVGYLGTAGAPDKGLIYLLQAWKILNYSDAVLVIAGRDSTSQWVGHLANSCGGGNIIFAGWQESTSKFYEGISLYVQPSCTEGFGLEVLEALAHGRPVLCSTGAGAVDIVDPVFRFPACDVDTLAAKINDVKNWAGRTRYGAEAREIAIDHTWDKIRQRYVTLWKELLS